MVPHAVLERVHKLGLRLSLTMGRFVLIAKWFQIFANYEIFKASRIKLHVLFTLRIAERTGLKIFAK